MVLRQATNRPRGVDFSDETCFRLVREIVTFDKRNQLVASTMVSLGSYSSRQTDHGKK